MYQAVKNFIAFAKHSYKQFYNQNKVHKTLLTKGVNNKISFDILVYGNLADIQLGENLKINEQVYLNVGGISGYGQNGCLSIGSNSVVGVATMLFAGGGRISIGKYCDIGNGVKILAHSLATNVDSNFSNPKWDYFDIEIGDYCQIGSGAIITGNTRLGKYCTVGAGSLVQGVFQDKTTLVSQTARAIPRKT